MNIRTTLLSISVLLMALLTSCDNDINDFDPELDPLKGKIAGQDWQYAAGNAQFDGFRNDVEGLIIGEGVQDPCGVRVTSKAHLRVRFPADRRNFTLPFIDNEGYVIFNHPNGAKRLTASAGFIEVVAISGTEVIGFINADFDDNNTVQGSFELRVCN